MSDPRRPDAASETPLPLGRRIVVRALDEYLARTGGPVGAPEPEATPAPAESESVLSGLRRRFSRGSRAPGPVEERGVRSERVLSDPVAETPVVREPVDVVHLHSGVDERDAREALGRVLALLDGVESEPLSANTVWTSAVREAIGERALRDEAARRRVHSDPTASARRP